MLYEWLTMVHCSSSSSSTRNSTRSSSTCHSISMLQHTSVLPFQQPQNAALQQQEQHCDSTQQYVQWIMQ